MPQVRAMYRVAMVKEKYLQNEIFSRSGKSHIGIGRGGASPPSLPPPPPPPPPPNNFGGGPIYPLAPHPSPRKPTHIFLQCLCEAVKLDHKCTNLIYVPIILFEGTSKSILFNSILNFAILSVLNVRNVIIWH